MRQAGILAAAGIVALDKMVDRLAEDHQRAKHLAAGLAEIPQISLTSPYTNIIRFQLAEGSKMKPERLVPALEKEGVRIGHGGPWGFRAVTHYWIDDAAIYKTLNVFHKMFKY